MQYITPEVMVSKSRCKYLGVKDMGQDIICNNRMRGNDVKELVFIHNCCTFLHKMSCLCLLVSVNYSHLPTSWDEKFLHVPAGLLWVRLVVVGSNTRQLSLVTRGVCHFTLLLKHEPEVTVIPTGALRHCGWKTYYLEDVTSMMTLFIPRSRKTDNIITSPLNTDVPTNVSACVSSTCLDRCHHSWCVCPCSAPVAMSEIERMATLCMKDLDDEDLEDDDLDDEDLLVTHLQYRFTLFISCTVWKIHKWALVLQW